MAVPYHRPSIGHNEKKAVEEVLESGWLTTGQHARSLEVEVAELVGAKYAVCLNSATAALHLALEAFGVGPGDEVIIPTHTFAATGEVVFYTGATPVLVDVLRDTLSIDPGAVEMAITNKTKVIIPVHYGGQAADMESILALAGSGISVLGDAAHALPTRHGKKMVGSIGRATAFSFYANKTITTGEGGVLTTDDEKLAQRVRLLSLHGLDRDAWNRFKTGASWEYDIIDAGYKYNLTDVAAAMGRVQLGRAEELRASRERVARRYDQAFASVEHVEPLVVDRPQDSAWHLYVIRLNLENLSIDRNEFIDRMSAAEVGTSVHYKPLHLHTLYKERFRTAREDFPVSSEQYDRIVSLPIFPDMTGSEVEEVIGKVSDIVKGATR